MVVMTLGDRHYRLPYIQSVSCGGDRHGAGLTLRESNIAQSRVPFIFLKVDVFCVLVSPTHLEVCSVFVPSLSSKAFFIFLFSSTTTPPVVGNLVTKKIKT